MFASGRTKLLAGKEAAGRLDKSSRQSHSFQIASLSLVRTATAIMVHICIKSVFESGTILRTLYI